MILITSGAYIDSSLATEFGNLPPTMLPVQNKRLYEHQIELIRKTFGKEKIILSLPSSYKLSDYEKSRLDKLNVEVVLVNEQLSLGESIASILCNLCDNKLYILHGDTLFSTLSKELNICSIGYSNIFYKWTNANSLNKVFTGFFSFSSSDKLLKTLIEKKYNFINSIQKLSLKEIELDGWLDFSLTSTYYKSVSKFTTQRVFNDLYITEYTVTKSSKDTLKMQAEANWLKNVPASIKSFTPQVYKNTKDSYTIEYLYNSSLSNIFVFGCLDFNSLKNILSLCIDYINLEKQYKPEEKINTNYLYTEKTLSRLSDYNLDEKYIINGENVGSLKDIITDLDKYIDKDCYKYNSIMHGDLCFSNILYDSRSNHIKLIDPRGLDNNHNISIYGDWRYDVAKLAHSIIGKYDLIIANRFIYKEISKNNIEFTIESNNNLQDLETYFNYFFDYKIYYPIMINLFLSMIPLHRDNKLRQKAMFANSLYLYLTFKNKLKEENEQLS